MSDGFFVVSKQFIKKATPEGGFELSSLGRWRQAAAAKAALNVALGHMMALSLSWDGKK